MRTTFTRSLRTCTHYVRALFLSLLFFSAVLESSAQLKAYYYIKSPSKLIGEYLFNPCGTQYSADFNLGFSWVDTLPADVTITDIQIEFNIGMEFSAGYHDTYLNYNYTGTVNTDFEDYYDCPDRTNVKTVTGDVNYYNVNSYNEFTLDQFWESTFLCKTPDLNNSYAKITVTYTPYFSGPVPSITSFTPHDGNTCETMTIYGTNFDNNILQISIGDATLTQYTYVSPEEISFDIPATATSGQVTIITGGGVATSDTMFVLTPTIPSITSLSTETGTMGTAVVITGDNLECPISVDFGGYPASSWTVNSPTQITAIVANGDSGDVSVVTAGGTATYPGFNYVPPPDASTMNITGSSALDTIDAHVSTVVDPTLLVTANGVIDGFTVAITGSYTNGDELGFDNDLPEGISTNGFDPISGVIRFEGRLTAAQWQEFLRSITLTTTYDVCFPERREVTFIGGSCYYNISNGHFYQYEPGSYYWSDARANAAASSYFGRQGYLVTLTSQAENNFVWKIMQADAWIGCSDNYLEINNALAATIYNDSYESEGNYYWVAGPEKGTPVSRNNACDLTLPEAIDGAYMNWNGGEPNDFPDCDPSTPGEEDYGQIYSSGDGLWNDLPNEVGLSFIIEYGGMPGDDESSHVVFTRQLYVSGAPGGTITGGGGTVCPGTNSTTLTINGLDGDVVRWEYSLDNFLTPGIEIAETTTSIDVQDLEQTTYFRAIVNTNTPASCAELTTSSTVVNVSVTVPGNIIALNNTICPNSNAELTLFGNQGSVQYWQVSTTSDFSTDVTDLTDTATAISHLLTTLGSYYFRALVQNNGCGVPLWTNGKEIVVTTGTPPTGGVVSSAEHCGSLNSGTLLLTGFDGNIDKWQSSTNNGITWTDLPVIDDYLDYMDIPVTSLYRAVISNGSCGITYSETGSVIIYGNTEFKWIGGTDSDWGNPDNWLCGNIPGTGSDITFDSNAGNDLVLDQDYSVGRIDFAGSDRRVILGDHNLTITSATGTNPGNYFSTTGTGKLQITLINGANFSFPVGNSAYNPVTISNHTGSASVVSVRVLDEMYNDGTTGTVVGTAHVARTWDISSTNSGGSGLDFEFNWNDGEETGTITTPTLYHYNGSSWERQAGTTSPSAYSLTYTGYTGSFSPFGISDGNFTLPLNWISFTGQKAGKQTLLNWVTAQEQHTKDFVVQHSADGSAWSPIGIVNAANTASGNHSYSFVHTNPVTGANYYRLLQRDIDGKASYSKTVRVSFTESNKLILVYPNPVRQQKLNVELPAAMEVKLYSTSGTLLISRRLGAGTSELDLTRFAKGLYLLKAGDSTFKIVVE